MSIDKKKVIKLREKGLTLKQIGEKLNVTRQAIHCVLNYDKTKKRLLTEREKMLFKTKLRRENLTMLDWCKVNNIKSYSYFTRFLANDSKAVNIKVDSREYKLIMEEIKNYKKKR